MTSTPSQRAPARILFSNKKGDSEQQTPIKHYIHQIHYDEATVRLLDPGFVPLDNTANTRPDWYEFWVMLRFLQNHELEEDAWYGFLSPKFRLKTGLRSGDVLNFLRAQQPGTDVALFSPSWDQIAYFLSPFEQGEFWHPGLQVLAQELCDELGLKVDLNTLVAHSHSSVFSNYIVAKPAFWRTWLAVAQPFFALVERGDSSLSKGIGSDTSYGSTAHRAPMKAFMQERLTTLILAQSRFKIASFDFSVNSGIFNRLFTDEPKTRRLLQTCDVLKQQYCATDDEDYLMMFRKIRALIPVKFSLPNPIKSAPGP